MRIANAAVHPPICIFQKGGVHMNDFPKRKRIRIKHYDYSQNGAYFLTIATKDKRKILWSRIRTGAVGAVCVHPPQPFNCAAVFTDFRPQLSKIGMTVEKETIALSNIYNNVYVDHFVVMPNHVHMIIVIRRDCERTHTAPTASRIIKQWKGAITKKIGFSIWQKSFYDHIIRTENEYLLIAQYIENNPLLWEQDCYYVETP
jgi:REP element-mobilizing transposase RayT